MNEPGSESILVDVLVPPVGPLHLLVPEDGVPALLEVDALPALPGDGVLPVHGLGQGDGQLPGGVPAGGILVLPIGTTNLVGGASASGPVKGSSEE